MKRRKLRVFFALSLIYFIGFCIFCLGLYFNDIIKIVVKNGPKESDIMNEKLEYRSTIKSMPFLYLEVKKAASLKIQGLSDIQIKEKSICDNIFQMNTEARKKEIASIALRRINILDDFLISKLVNGSVTVSKLINLYSIMKTDRLFFEFMKEVYAEKILIKEFCISDKDFNIYFQRKKEQSEKVATWKEYTFYKLKQVFIRILFESGLIKNQKDDREIIKPIINEDLRQHFKSIGDGYYIDVLLGEI